MEVTREKVELETVCTVYLRDVLESDGLVYCF